MKLHDEVQPIKIILADAHYIARMGIRSMLSEIPDFIIVAETVSSHEVLKESKKYKPDVVIMDYNIQDSFTMEDLKKIKLVSPKTNILVISSDPEKQNIYKVLDYGIKNFLTKECDPEEIISAVYATAKNEKFFCSRVVDIILEKHLNKKEEDCEPSVLSQRENEIVVLIAKGFTGKEIAKELFLSHHTVNTHRKNIMRKLRINSTSELVLYAINFGLITSEK